MISEFLNFCDNNRGSVGLGAGFLAGILLSRAGTRYQKKRKKVYLRLWEETQQDLFLSERRLEDAQLELTYLRKQVTTGKELNDLSGKK
jgi:hypothetical protein